MKIYVASSWRNVFQSEMVELLRAKGYPTYDFRNPATGGPVHEDTPTQGFSWRECDPNYRPGDLEAYKRMLQHHRAIQGFNADFAAMKWADACVLVMPSGRSAHIEAGWMAGAGKKLVVYHPPTRDKCKVCAGIGRMDDPYDHMRSRLCPVEDCADGWRMLWAFDPELMYLVGGPNVIATSFEEVLSGLEDR